MTQKELKEKIYLLEKSIEEHIIYIKSLNQEFEDLKLKLSYAQLYTERQRIFAQSIDTANEIKLAEGKLVRYSSKLSELKRLIK